ncbi:hypothetical protein CHF27_010830 [Romboutsia maritimum]|uniref:Uncharacterized protein n=1 Tax=Romboutsia maritimum TaxID=2020948 RepID=A0A371IQZ7_9FIRM|nr:hypothetical protein CHF27_010830 [Romboutsia maritimum]
MDGYIGFRGERKETLDDIIYIKYIGSEDVPFKTVEGRLKNGKYISFKEGKTFRRYIFNIN